MFTMIHINFPLYNRHAQWHNYNTCLLSNTKLQRTERSFHCCVRNIALTLNPPNNFRLLQISSALIFKVLQCHSRLFNFCLSVKQLGSGWDAELLGVSSGSKLFACDTLVVICWLRAKLSDLRDPEKLLLIDLGTTSHLHGIYGLVPCENGAWVGLNLLQEPSNISFKFYFWCLGQIRLHIFVSLMYILIKHGYPARVLN